MPKPDSRTPQQIQAAQQLIFYGWRAVRSHGTVHTRGTADLELSFQGQSTLRVGGVGQYVDIPPGGARPLAVGTSRYQIYFEDVYTTPEWAKLRILQDVADPYSPANPGPEFNCNPMQAPFGKVVDLGFGYSLVIADGSAQDKSCWFEIRKAGNRATSVGWVDRVGAGSTNLVVTKDGYTFRFVAGPDKPDSSFDVQFFL